MTETLQLEEAIEFDHEPKLLVEWSSPWEEFVTSIRPALARSTARLAGEAPYGLLPYRGMLTTLGIEALLLFAVIVLPAKIAQMRPYAPPKLASRDVIYYSGDELPRTEDLAGSQSGAAGRSGGAEAHHRTQTIRISRGGSLVEKVVDAPNLKLPASRDAVANLLAIKPNPGPPPSEGLRSSRTVLTLPQDVVAPAPTVTRDYTKGAPSLQAVIPPSPSLSRDKPLSAPALNATVIAPAPNVSREQALIAPRLDSRVVAPAPSVSRERARTAPALSGTIIPPAPNAESPQISRSPVQMTNVAVVPPPVSAPEREARRNSKLTLPAPSVIAPPPSADATPDLHRLASGSVPDPSKTVVPPPPTQPASGLMSSLIGKIFGTTDVVPPPPSVIGSNASSSPRGAAGGTGTSLGTNVVPPPPSVGGLGTGSRSAAAGTGGSLATNVIAPPPSVSGSGRGAGGASGSPDGTLLASNVVPPPPSIGGGTSLSGSGRGAKRGGLGGLLDTGSVLAPPGGGGSGGGSGVVLSSQPGSQVGMPGNGAAGSLAMSPAGGDKPGLGGAGGGASIGRGNGPGSGMAGEGAGAGKAGTGHGSDPNARGGISPTPGPGGAGSGTSGTPAIPGVSISGGSTAIINLPSFGSDGGSGTPSAPGRSSVKAQAGPAITIIATARSGGAFNRYGELPGDNRSFYFDTAFGLAAIQYADPDSATHSYFGELGNLQPLRFDLPVGLEHSQIVVRCIIDASGNLKVVGLLESGSSDVTVKVLSALAKWKFRPAMRGDQPVQVNAILGFNINTDDKF